MNWYQIYATIVTGIGVVACGAFCVDYWRMSRGYRKSEYWWLFISFPASLGFLLLFVFVSRLLGNSIGRQIAGAILYTAFIVMVPWLHRLMRRSMAAGSVTSQETPTTDGSGE